LGSDFAEGKSRDNKGGVDEDVDGDKEGVDKDNDCGGKMTKRVAKLSTCVDTSSCDA